MEFLITALAIVFFIVVVLAMLAVFWDRTRTEKLE